MGAQARRSASVEPAKTACEEEIAGLGGSSRGGYAASSSFSDGEAAAQTALISALASAEPQLSYSSAAASSAATEANLKLVYVEQTATGYRLGDHSASGALITLTVDRSSGYAPVFSGGAGSAVVQVALPTSPVLPTISGTVQVGQVLNASPGTWTGSPTTYSYQWQRCDSGGAACADLSGQTATAYTLVSADVGQTVRVVVTATNSAGSTNASSAATASVAGTTPWVTVGS